MKKIRIYLSLYLVYFFTQSVLGQYGPEYLGWYGQTIIPDEVFYDQSQWTANAGGENSCTLTVSDTSVDMHWRLEEGKDQWVQCYILFDPPISLSPYDVFGYDVHGSVCDAGYPCHKEHVVEIKFEDNTRQAIHTRMGEDGILCVDRWMNKLSSNRYDNFFSIPEGFQWDSVRIFSFGVKSHPWVDHPLADSGTVSFRNLVGDSIGSWIRGLKADTLTVIRDTLVKIKNRAIDFLISRQQSTGLLTTWSENGSSWLYGQGLALKALSIEGEWELGIPINQAAEAATKLACFLSSHQESDGYWPRAWNSISGAVIVPYEDDGSIWMGDLPWILTGLYSYLKKSGDCTVFPSILKAEAFLRSLIDSDGSFYTMNLLTEQRIPVTSTEAYTSMIGALIEIGDTILAKTMIDYIDSETWDDDLRFWREGVYSDRIVLFANTWLGLIAQNRGYREKSFDAISLTGRLMYTCGPGEPYGLDGIGPIAVWYEGTLSYIASGGPGSNTLFNNIRPYINNNGSVPHYNDDIEGTAGIWAEKWNSLDGTSWLYFVTSKQSPFEPTIANQDYECYIGVNGSEFQSNDIIIIPNPCSDFFLLKNIPTESTSFYYINLYRPDGKIILKDVKLSAQDEHQINIESLSDGLYLLRITIDNNTITKPIIKIGR